jgi:hypothetical protein
MRKFITYKKELTLDCFSNNQPLKKGVKNNDVKKVQEWLCLNSILYPHLKQVEIDNDFGKITENAVKDFQAFKNLEITGTVDKATFFELTKPLRNSFELNDFPFNNIREAICRIAFLHFKNTARELTKNKIGNLGPWVRSYCNGYDGDDYWWCCGFVKTIFDIACDISNAPFTNFMVNSLSCDDVANLAISKNKLIRNIDLEDRISEIQPGDIFFKYSPDNGSKWHHIGIITKVEKNGIIETIEGNAASDRNGNIGDTSNGIGVFSKCRDLFNRKKLTDSEGNQYWDYYEVYKIN